MAIEVGDYLLVTWHEYEILRGPEDLRALLERACPTHHRDHEVDRCIDELGHGHIVAVRRTRSRFDAFAPRSEPATASVPTPNPA